MKALYNLYNQFNQVIYYFYPNQQQGSNTEKDLINKPIIDAINKAVINAINKDDFSKLLETLNLKQPYDQYIILAQELHAKISMFDPKASEIDAKNNEQKGALPKLEDIFKKELLDFRAKFHQCRKLQNLIIDTLNNYNILDPKFSKFKIVHYAVYKAATKILAWLSALGVDFEVTTLNTKTGTIYSPLTLAERLQKNQGYGREYHCLHVILKETYTLDTEYNCEHIRNYSEPIILKLDLITLITYVNITSTDVTMDYNRLFNFKDLMQPSFLSTQIA